MSLSKMEHFNKILQHVQTAQFFSEILINYRGNASERSIYGLYTVFELIKLKNRISKWQQQKDKYIFISENNQAEKHDILEEQKQEEFIDGWQDSLQSKIGEQDEQQQDTISLMKNKLKQQFDNIKKDKPKFNIGYQDVLNKTHNKIGVITTLPIPEVFKRPNNQKMTLQQFAIYLGEIIYLIRPLIYCLLLFKYGSNSYTPYMISLILDIIRFILQRKAQFFRRCEKVEMKERLRSAIIAYALRNPFYQEFLRAKFVDPILEMLFGKTSKIAKLIIYLIEIRSSRSLLL